MGKVRLENEPDDFVARGLRYAEDVISGAIPACKWVRLACQRQLDDLKRTDWEWTFDPDRANRICEFIELLPHVKGRWKTKTITLEAHQCFRLTVVFGWVNAGGIRRFRKVLVVIPRKNGKTTEAAGVGIYGTALDKEPGAEVYAAAVTRDQVTGPSGVFTVARQLVERCTGLRERFGVTPHRSAITVLSDGSAFKPVSRDAGALEGFNTHFGIIDELHAHKTREVFDVIDESTGARSQPLLYIISTEGDDPNGVFAEQVEYGQQVLEAKPEDRDAGAESFFFIYYSIDPEDDWTTPEAWAKANPNLGVSIFTRDLEVRCAQARKNAASQASFLTKRLNVRVGAGEAFFNMLAWGRLCKDESIGPEDFYGQPCFVTIDLASKIDLAVKMLVFEKNGLLYLFAKHYLPERQLEKGHPNYDVYRGWATKEYITLTEGDIIDYEFIERDLLEDAQNYQILKVGIDPHNATQFNTRMQAQGLPIEEISQGILSLSEPAKELAARIIAGKVRHDGDPVLNWMIGNAIPKKDANDNVKLRKARDASKIDGAITAVMGTKLVMLNPNASEFYRNGLMVL